MGLSGAERQARWRAKRDAEIAALRKAAGGSAKRDGKAEPSSEPETIKSMRAALGKAWNELANLRQQLAAAAKPPTEQVAELHKHTATLGKELARERREHAATKAKVAKPLALDPDSEAARQIKGLKTRVQNLRAELANAYRRMKQHGKMTAQARNAIVMGLHTDRMPTKEERHNAMAALNEFWDDQKKAGRAA